MFPSVDILGVKVACLDQETLLAQVEGWTQHTGSHTIMYVNAHCLNQAVEDPDYRSILNRADLIYPDGIGAVWAARFLSKARLFKLTGREVVAPIFAWAEISQARIFILAGKPGVAERACREIHRRWSRVQVAGVQHGFVAPEHEDELLSEIEQSHPQVLFVGMGVPRQEKWVASHIERLKVPVVWTVGAFFDYLAGEERIAPSWLDRLWMEWLWRLAMDPGGKWHRYLIGNPRFVMRVLCQKWL